MIKIQHRLAKKGEGKDVLTQGRADAGFDSILEPKVKMNEISNINQSHKNPKSLSLNKGPMKQVMSVSVATLQHDSTKLVTGS